MPVVFDVSVERVIKAETDYPSEIVNKWATVLKSLRDTILSRIQTKIPDAPTYENVLATPSYLKYGDFVNPSFPKADWIKMKQRVKVLAGANRYLDGVQKAFTVPEGATVSPFETAIDNKKDKIKGGILTLSVVGTRYGDDDIIPAIVRALTGDKRGELILSRKGISGTITTLTNLFPADIISVVRPSIIALLVEGGVLLAYAGQSGLTTEYDSIMSSINAALDKIFNLRDTTTYPTAYIHYEDPSDRTRYLRIHAYVESAS